MTISPEINSQPNPATTKAASLAAAGYAPVWHVQLAVRAAANTNSQRGERARRAVRHG